MCLKSGKRLPTEISLISRKAGLVKGICLRCQPLPLIAAKGCSVPAAEEVLCRLSEENQQLKEAVKARCSPDVMKSCGPSPMHQLQSLASVCTLLDAVIQRATGSGQ